MTHRGEDGADDHTETRTMYTKTRDRPTEDEPTNDCASDRARDQLVTLNADVAAARWDPEHARHILATGE